MASKSANRSGRQNKKDNPQIVYIDRIGITAYYTGGNTHWMQVLTGHKKPSNIKNDPEYLLERIRQRILFLKKYNNRKTLKPEHYNITEKDNPYLYNMFLHPEEYKTKYSYLDTLIPIKEARYKVNKQKNNENI